MPLLLSIDLVLGFGLEIGQSLHENIALVDVEKRKGLIPQAKGLS